MTSAAHSRCNAWGFQRRYILGVLQENHHSIWNNSQENDNVLRAVSAIREEGVPWVTGGTHRSQAVVLSGFRKALPYAVTISCSPSWNQLPFPARNRSVGCEKGRSKQKRRNYPPLLAPDVSLQPGAAVPAGASRQQGLWSNKIQTSWWHSRD